ncbi:MAG: AAA family ATPase [Emcibacter sp.]|nr:AAA family ATPase [Emcibacter sp.]
MSFIIKHKPITFNDVVISDKNVCLQLRNWLATKSQEPLILYGPSGTGKSSIAKLLPYAMYADFDAFDLQWIIADGRNNLAGQLNDLKAFCGVNSLSFSNNRFVVIDEIDNLKPEVQRNLKGYIDQYSGVVHFVFTTNFLNKIDKAIQSRCRKMKISHSNMSAWLPRLKHIMKLEGYANIATDAELLNIASKANGDCRSALRKIEDLVVSLEGANIRKSYITSAPSSSRTMHSK